MAKESSHGKMVAHTKVISNRTMFMDMEFIDGVKKENTKDK